MTAYPANKQLSDDYRLILDELRKGIRSTPRPLEAVLENFEGRLLWLPEIGDFETPLNGLPLREVISKGNLRQWLQDYGVETIHVAGDGNPYPHGALELVVVETLQKGLERYAERQLKALA